MVRTCVVLLAILLALPAVADDARDKAFRDAVALIDAGKPDEAIAALKKLVAEDPSDSIAAYELGLAYADKGDYARCQSTAAPILQMKDADRRAILVLLGNCLDQSGERAKAIGMYREALKIAPDSADALFNLAVALYADGKLDEARELLKHDAEKNPWHRSAHLALAKVFEEQGFPFPALMSYLRFLALEPATERSADAVEHLKQLLGTGYTKTEKGANLTVDLHGRKEEGDYGVMQLSLALTRASTALPPEGKPKETPSEFDQTRNQIRHVINIFLEQGIKGHDDYTARVQWPFFTKMNGANVTDAFAVMALSSLKLPGAAEWTQTNEKAVTAFSDWMRPQTRPPAVLLRK